jgi:hypothetical protein
METITDKLVAQTAEEYKKVVDDWAMAFARRHIPKEELAGGEPNLMSMFLKLRDLGIIPHCVQSELIIGQPQTVTYSFTSGDMILAELTIKLSFDNGSSNKT